MKQVFVRNYIFSICFLMFSMVMHPELLIVKKTVSGFSSLSDEESLLYNDKIAEILQKYQWPMCLSSDLTEDEKNELLTADVPYAEELFIQKKLQQVMPELNLQVIFMPTSLYELFCLVKYADIDDDLLKNVHSGTVLHFNPLLQRQDLSPLQVRMQMQDAFKKANAVFFEKQNTAILKLFDINFMTRPSIAVSINKNLFDFVKQQYPEIDSCKDGQAISLYIHNHSLSKLCLLFLEMLKMPSSDNNFFVKKCLLQSELDNFSNNQIIQHVVRLEYEAREQNKAMLLRGSGLTDMSVSMGEQPVKKLLAGSTFYKELDWLSGSFEEIPFWKKYKEKNNLPYSISFGTSLFAGILTDWLACAYVFLSGCDKCKTSMDAQSSVKPVGYGLFINKKDYVQHQNNNLFYIPSLGTLASLFAYGEWFHARVKAAIHKSKQENVYVKGVLHESFWDPTGVLLITRDPLKHAELFSNFLVQNGRLIQPGDASLLTDAKIAFIDDVMKAQTEAADLYKAMRTITPKIEKATQKFKKNKQSYLNWMQDFKNI